MKSNISFEERQQLYKELVAFSNDRILGMKNNGNAEIFQFEKCTMEGAWYYIPIKGIMNADFHDVDKQLARLYGAGARVKPEMRGDGDGYITYIIINTDKWKTVGSTYSNRGANRSSFQAVIIYFLTLLLFLGALYYMLQNA